MTLPAFAAERGRLQQISIYGWYAPPDWRDTPEIRRFADYQDKQTSRTLLPQLIDGTDRRTDSRPF